MIMLPKSGINTTITSSQVARAIAKFHRDIFFSGKMMTFLQAFASNNESYMKTLLEARDATVCRLNGRNISDTTPMSMLLLLLEYKTLSETSVHSIARYPDVSPVLVEKMLFDNDFNFAWLDEKGRTALEAAACCGKAQYGRLNSCLLLCGKRLIDILLGFLPFELAQMTCEFIVLPDKSSKEVSLTVLSLHEAVSAKNLNFHQIRRFLLQGHDPADPAILLSARRRTMWRRIAKCWRQHIGHLRARLPYSLWGCFDVITAFLCPVIS